MCERRETKYGLVVAFDRMCPARDQSRRDGSARSEAALTSDDCNYYNTDDCRSRFQPAESSPDASVCCTNTRQEQGKHWPLLSRDLNSGHSFSCGCRRGMFLLGDDSGSTCVTNNNHGDNAHKSVLLAQSSLIVERRELARGGEEVGQFLVDDIKIDVKIRTSRRLAASDKDNDNDDHESESSEQQVRVASGCGWIRFSRLPERETSEMSDENFKPPSSAISSSSIAASANNQMPSFQEIAGFRWPNKMKRSRMFLGLRLIGSSVAQSQLERSLMRPRRFNSKLLFLDFTLPILALVLILTTIIVPIKSTSTSTKSDLDERQEALPLFAPIRRSSASQLIHASGGALPRGFDWQAPLTTYSDREQQSANAPQDLGVNISATSSHNSGHEHEVASSMRSPKFTRTNELEAFLDDMNHRELQTVASGRQIEDLFQPKPFDVSLLASNSNRRPQTGGTGIEHPTAAGRSAPQAPQGQDRSLLVGTPKLGSSGLMGSQSEQQIYSDCALILQRTYVKNMEDPKHHQLVPFGKTEQACISYKHIDKAIEQAKHKLKFREFVKIRKQTAASVPLAGPPPPPPLDVLHTSLEPPEDLVAAIGEINMAATQIIADQFDLSNDELLNGLPLIDMSKTKFAAICPLLVRQDLKCELTRFRTFTAHCNNLKHPTWGAAKTPYARYLPPVHPDGIWVPRKSIVSEISFDLGVGHRETHTDYSPSMQLSSVHQDDVHHGRQHFPATSQMAFGAGLHHHRAGLQRTSPSNSLVNSLDEPNINELESQADAELMRDTRHNANQLDTAASVHFASHAHPDNQLEHLMQLKPAPLTAGGHFGRLDHIQGETRPTSLMHQQSQFAAFNEAAAAHAHIHHMDPQTSAPPPLGSVALPSLPEPILHQVGQKTRSVAQELPSARLVSSLVHRDADIPHHEFSMLFQSWGQLLDHDMTRAAAPPQTIKCCPSASGQRAAKQHKLCLPIKVPANDPFYSKFNVQCLEFRRTLASVRPNCVLGPRVHQNANTAPIDANFVYGSSQATADLLRLFKGGRLRDRDWFRAEGLKPLLPAQEIEPDLNCLGRPRDMFCFLGGDVRVNEQTHLTVLHTLYMREHNRIADKLSELNPHWDDERTFQETRHLVAAGVQHVLVNEYIPLLIGRKMAELYNLTVSTPAEFAHSHHQQQHARGLYWHGYDPTVTTSVANSFAAAAFRQGHTFVQSTIDRFNKFHEFLSSEKLRHLFMQPWLLYQPGVMDELISGMINRQSQSYDPFITEELAGHLFQPPEAEFGLDLAAINVQRGRDQGLPGYNLFREWCGLPRAETFEQLEPYLTNRTAFLYSKLYKHVDDIDLWSAGVSERKLPGAAIGPTFSCIIARQFSNTRRGDRFWYENPNLPSSFTPDQLNEIKKLTMAKLLCNNADDLPTIQQWAFRVAHPVLNPRVECSQLPEIDLQYWQEE